MTINKKEIFVHRDIKNENILVSKDDEGKEVFKLADFGFSKTISNENELMFSYIGTPLYMPPQIHLQEKYTSKSDIFSLGVLFF